KLLAIVQEEAKAEEKGLAARLERAARMVAALRGLGYAGAYIGGDHNAEHVAWIINRSEEIAGNWEQYANEITYGPKNGFYFYESKPETKPMRPLAQVLDSQASMFPENSEDTGPRP